MAICVTDPGLKTDMTQHKSSPAQSTTDGSLGQPLPSRLAQRVRTWRQRLKRGPQSLRGQLIVSIWLGLAIIFIPFNIIKAVQEMQAAVNENRKHLSEQGAFVFFGVRKWRQSMRELLLTMAIAPPVRRLDTADTKMIFDQMEALFPHRSWRLWNAAGDLLVGTHILVPAARMNILARPYFQQSRQGKVSQGIISNCLSGRACFVESVPVYGPGVTSYSTGSATPVGVLTINVDLGKTGADSGLSDLRGEIMSMIDARHSHHDDRSPWATDLSFQHGNYTGMESLMVSRSGHVIFPISEVNDDISLQSPEQIAKGPWGPVVAVGRSRHTGEGGTFQEVRVAGRAYFTYSRPIDEDWTLVAVTDRDSSYYQVCQRITREVLFQLATLLGITLAVAYVSRRAATPILMAASTIREFSHGNFEARLSDERSDEIGLLYRDINTTGGSLRELLNQKLAHAVTDQQVKTATEIQKSFIVATLPDTEVVDLAADFDPAYEIGADWYDALNIGEITYVVIADVCDKGIASALFMSVFRSLLRYALLDETLEMGGGGIESSLLNAISQTNDYMATNHADTTMFATLFLGAYVNSTRRLSYVCAGHESPIIVRAPGVLERLPTTGPAVGIFAGASYGVESVALEPGQILFTYTDGLVDARSPSNVAWGLEGVQGVLCGIDPRAMSAGDLLQRMTEKVRVHREDAEQFDDLTMLIMKIRA